MAPSLERLGPMVAGCIVKYTSSKHSSGYTSEKSPSPTWDSTSATQGPIMSQVAFSLSPSPSIESTIAFSSFSCVISAVFGR
jgi:hypothetical protein